MSFISSRLLQIKPSSTLSIIAQTATLKAQGKDIIGLGAGEPDFDTPCFIKDAAIKAIEAGKTKYTAIEGIFPLRKAIAKKFKEDNGIECTPEQIIVGAGAKQVIFNAFLASLDLGDEVIIPTPYWVSYPDMVEIAGGKPVLIPCPQSAHFKLSSEALTQAITPKTKWLILNSPNNPTGVVYSASDLENLACVLRKHPHVHVLSDDIYEYILYDDMSFSTLAQVAPDLKDRILTVNGVSKSYSMTGWRIGYGVGPLELIKAMATLQSQSTTNACSISQEAALAALEGDQSFRKEWLKIFKERRNQALDIFNNTPDLSCCTPEGAFYLYVDCSKTMGKTTPAGMPLKNDTDLSSYLLDAAGVAVVPGAAFGLSPYFRISYATETDLLIQACQRIAKAIKELSSS